MNATSTRQLPEIGAAHVLAVHLHDAVLEAWVPGHVHRVSDWIDLPLPQKRMYIAEALAFLERYKPQEKPVIATGLRRSDKIIGAICPNTERAR